MIHGFFIRRRSTTTDGMRARDDGATTRGRSAIAVVACVGGAALAAVALLEHGETMRAWYAGGSATAMLGGADARAEDVREARAALGMPPRYPNSAAASARRARRAKTRREARRMKAGRDGIAGVAERGWDDASLGLLAPDAVPEYEAQAFKVPVGAVEKTAEELNKMEGYGYDERGELVGDAWRREWRREQDEIIRESLSEERPHSRARHHPSHVQPSLGSRPRAELGASHHHHHHREKKASGKKAKSDDGDSSKLGSKGEPLKTPVYIMSMGDKSVHNPDPVLGRTDSERTEHLLKELVREFGTAAIKSYVRLTPGVDVRDWPHEEDTMHFALKSIMKNKAAGTQLSTLPWLSFYTSRDKDGHFSDKFAKERNLYTHIGCLFGHMFQWQLAADANDKQAFMLESDAFDPSIVGMPFKDMQALADNAPKEYDIIFFDQPKDVTFDEAPEHKFKDANGSEIYLFRLKSKNTQSGLSASLVSRSFYPKLFKHLSHFGGDVVDSMLKSQLCTDSMVDATGKFTGFGAGNKPWLKCYWALPAKKAKESHGKFVYNNY